MYNKNKKLVAGRHIEPRSCAAVTLLLLLFLYAALYHLLIIGKMKNAQNICTMFVEYNRQWVGYRTEWNKHTKKENDLVLSHIW